MKTKIPHELRQSEFHRHILTAKYIQEFVCYIVGKTSSNGIAVTSAGQLPCFHIIHIDAQYGGDWTTIIENVLVEADSLQIESVAFPALGTGTYTASAKRRSIGDWCAIFSFYFNLNTFYLTHVAYCHCERHNLQPSAIYDYVGCDSFLLMVMMIVTDCNHWNYTLYVILSYINSLSDGNI